MFVFRKYKERNKVGFIFEIFENFCIFKVLLKINFEVESNC